MGNKTARQPLLSDETVVLRAPIQVWSAADGAIGGMPIHGVYCGDTRVVSSLHWTLDDLAGEFIATLARSVDCTTFVALHRDLDDSMPDPRVRSMHTRTATIEGVTSEIALTSDLEEPVEVRLSVHLDPDLTSMDLVKSGAVSDVRPRASVLAGVASWGDGAVEVSVRADGATTRVMPDGSVGLDWDVTVPARGETVVAWHVHASDARSVVGGVAGAPEWSALEVRSQDERLARWLHVAMDDLDGLRIRPTRGEQGTILAAGAPWFFTIFGRDSIWAARFLLPTGTGIAHDTLRILAELQGTSEVAETAEQPGKILHELRRSGVVSLTEGFTLPPLYYGTVDATPLWVCLLHDSWRWGLADDDVRTLLPTVVAALRWMRDHGDSDGDHLLEYVDSTGRGLSNQGWKDSGDSVQWRDGTLAEGPIALCEVQAYAYEAATHGADMLEHFDIDGAQEWRDWAEELKRAFHERFWIQHADGDYPAIALDASKRAVDGVTSNIGHLLGTGLLDAAQSELVARRLLSPAMNSGFGLRTMGTDSDGYWPLSYHGGSVWTHDTAIAITGLAKEGFHTEAAALATGLLDAAAHFDYRMPELYSGDAAGDVPSPVPYPASCRPQAWAAAAAVAVLSGVLGLQPDAGSASLRVATGTTRFLPLSVGGLKLADQPVSMSIDADGTILAASGADIVPGGTVRRMPAPR